MLSNYGLTGSQIIGALSADNRTISAGTVERGGQDLQLRIVGEYTSIDDIKNTLIPLNNGDTFAFEMWRMLKIPIRKYLQFLV